MIIIITPPEDIPHEASIANRLFEEGISILHLRKPGADRESYIRYIEAISPKYRNRIVLHDHFELVQRFALKGIHLRREQAETFAETARYPHVSVSCHSFKEIDTLPFRPNYVFLSPVFDSISKPGYRSAFPLETLRAELPRREVPIVALGGVTAENAATCWQAGFAGIALLGYIWEQPKRVKLLQAGNFVPPPLLYITDEKEGMTLPEQVEAVCQGGCRWVQLRMKGKSTEEIVRIGREVKTICARHHAYLSINDNVEAARLLEADGVHVGKSDLPIPSARELLPPPVFIGATCNTWEDIKAVHQEADYIGLGPYTYTTTKKRLAPVLGLEGYRHIMAACQEQKITCPIYAIGGIREKDIPALMATGITGIALSSLIKESDNLTEKTKTILAIINTH